MRNGHIKRITDPDIQSSVLEIAGTNVSTTYVTCPADPKQTLGIKLPFLVMIIKNVRELRACGVRTPLAPCDAPMGVDGATCPVHLTPSPSLSPLSLAAVEEVLHV